MVKNLPANTGDRGDMGPIPWRRKNAPVFLPGESHEYRGLAGCSPWGHKELDMIERTHTSHVVGGAVSSSILNIAWCWLSLVSRTALAIGLPEPWRNLKHVWGRLGCVQANKDRLKGLINTHPHWNSAAMNV